MNYEVKDLNLKDEFEGKGVRFSNGKSFVYWQKKGNQSIQSVEVVFDNSFSNMRLSDGGVCVLLDHVREYADIRSCIFIFCRENPAVSRVPFTFLVHTEREEQIVERLQQELEIQVVMNYTPTYARMKEEKKKSENAFMEKDVREKDEAITDSNREYYGENNELSTVEKMGEQLQEASLKVNISSDGVVGKEEVTSIFYVDDDGSIYSDDDQKVGMVGVDGYGLDYEHNTLVRNGQVIGMLGSFHDRKMNPSKSSKLSNPKVRTLKKKSNRAAFVSFPVILFILSGVLLITSIFLLFVYD